MRVPLQRIDRRVIVRRKPFRARLVLPVAPLLPDPPCGHIYLPPSRSCSSRSVRKLQVRGPGNDCVRREGQAPHLLGFFLLVPAARRSLPGVGERSLERAALLALGSGGG